MSGFNAGHALIFLTRYCCNASIKIGVFFSQMKGSIAYEEKFP
jgi:hypothetical protein